MGKRTTSLQPVTDTLALARAPGVPVEAEHVPSACLLCDAPATRQTGLCAKHAAQSLSAKEARGAAREMIGRAQLKYAADLAVASERASLRGDSRPAEFALLHGRALAPVQTATPGAAGGVSIQIAVLLPGLPSPTGDVSPKVIDGESETLLDP